MRTPRLGILFSTKKQKKNKSEGGVGGNQQPEVSLTRAGGRAEAPPEVRRTKKKGRGRRNGSLVHNEEGRTSLSQLKATRCESIIFGGVVEEPKGERDT